MSGGSGGPRTWTGMMLSIFTMRFLRALISSSFMLFWSFTSCMRHVAASEELWRGHVRAGTKPTSRMSVSLSMWAFRSYMFFF